MNGVERICAFYSRGPHFERLLAELRKRYPGAHLTAMIPPGYPPEAVEGLADECLTTGHAAHSLRQPAAVWSVLQLIRNGHYDVFVVMFPSAKLGLLARLTGIPRRFCQTPDGRFLPLRSTLLRTSVRTVYRAIRGRLLYAYIHYVVHHCPVKNPTNGPRPPRSD